MTITAIRFRGRICASLLLLCCALACIALALPALTFAAAAASDASAPSPKPADSKPPPPDPLGRSTPYGTVMGFLRAADSGDVKAASSYLEGKRPAKEQARLVADLEVVLNRGLKIGLEDLSRVPEGRLDDDLSPYMEKVGTATFGDESLDIVLRRTTKADTPPVWLFSSETLLGVTAAAEQLDLTWAEAIWPESFRELRILSYPVFRLLNLLLSIPVVFGIAWLLTRTLLWIARPLVVRYSPHYGAIALAQIKWLLCLLIFSLLGRFVAGQGVTAGGRIFFDYVASVLTIIAASWLMVRFTKLASNSKIQRLQDVRRPAKIAAVELFSWLLICTWIIAGLFLILRSLGVELTAAVAGLGVGGIAIAFAAQKTIENLFGTVMVVTDDAIRVGDYCQAGAVEGRVEHIGLRSTRIRTLDRTMVSIPNGQLAAISIGNVARRDKFLFRHNIRLRYDTSAGGVRDVLASIRKMMSEHPRLDAGSARTRLIRFGETSLELEAFAYVATFENDVFLEIQEELLLRIMDIVEASGAAVAAPTEAVRIINNFPADARPEDISSGKKTHRAAAAKNPEPETHEHQQ